MIGAGVCAAQPATISVQAGRPGAPINRSMWGIFFEDINFGADGGLYAEMVKNRGFEFPDPMMGWTRISRQLAQGQLAMRTTTRSMPPTRIICASCPGGTGPFGVSNEGFRGMGVKADEAYDFSAQIRDVAGRAGVAHPTCTAATARCWTRRYLKGFSSGWKQYTATLHPNDTDPKARLALMLDGQGHGGSGHGFACFRATRGKHRPGGLRADMVQMLADLNPGFMRFPGGCIVEGTRLEPALPMEKHHRPGRRTGRCCLIAGTPNSPTGRRRIISSLSAWASSSSSSCARTSARSRCRS